MALKIPSHSACVGGAGHKVPYMTMRTLRDPLMRISKMHALNVRAKIHVPNVRSDMRLQMYMSVVTNSL